MDEFLYCYKPSEISQSEGFYQFTTRGNDCRLIKSLASSDRRWKMEYIFVFGFWAGNPVDVGRDPFPPYTRDLGTFVLKVRPFPLFIFLLLFDLFAISNFCLLIAL